jgi:hypothetical protein
MDGSKPSFFQIIGSYSRVILLACVLALVPLCATAETGVTMIAIDRMTPGTPPVGFSFARTGQGGAGKWTVTSDASSPIGKAIEQTSTDRTDYRFPLAIYEGLSATNVDVEVRFKAVAGKTDRAGGIAVRLQDANNYYVARANALEDNVRFYRVVNGRREQLDGANLKVTPNEWHGLSLRAEGDRFTVFFDGRKLFSATDRTIAGAGSVALWTKSDIVTRFDQAKISVLP